MTDSKEIDNGGPAFSVCFEGGQNNGDSPYFHEGMSLRDWFAGQSLAGMFNHGGWINTIDDDQIEVAKRAYKIADAMIAARRASPLPADDGRAE